MLCVRGAHSSATVLCNCFPFSKKACETSLNQVQKTPLLTSDQADHHFGVLTWHDLSFQWQVLSKSGKEEMAPHCEIDMCKQKCAVEWVCTLTKRVQTYTQTHKDTHTSTHTTNYPNKREQTHTHTPSPTRVNEQTQTCTTVHAHNLILAHTHTPVHPPRACAHTKKRNYIENNEPPLNSHNVVECATIQRKKHGSRNFPKIVADTRNLQVA